MTERRNRVNVAPHVDEANVQARADELIAQMTPEEKAAQLTQYFYFFLPRDLVDSLDENTASMFEQQTGMVEDAVKHGTTGSLLFVADPNEINRLQRLALATGETYMLEFTVGPDERRYWSAAERDWVLDASTLDVWVGGDSTATLTTTFEVHS